MPTTASSTTASCSLSSAPPVAGSPVAQRRGPAPDLPFGAAAEEGRAKDGRGEEEETGGEGTDEGKGGDEGEEEDKEEQDGGG